MKKETTAPTGAEPRMLSADEVREIVERADKATPGPWEAYGPLHLHDGAYQYCEIVIEGARSPQIGEYDADGKRVIGGEPLAYGSDRFMEDAELTAHSRTDIPNLCYTVDRLREALISLKAEPMGNDEWGIKCIEDHNAIIDEALDGAPEPPNNDAEIARLAREYVAASKAHTAMSLEASAVDEFIEARKRLFNASRALIAAVEQEGR